MASYFDTMSSGDQSRYNDWFGKVGNWANDAMGKVPEWNARFTNPAEYSKAVVENMLQSTNAHQSLTPGYRDFLLQTAPQAYLLQQMMAMGRYGGPAGADFPQFYKNWLSPNYINNPNVYGYGGLPKNEMQGLWREFTGKYNQMLGGDAGQQYMSELSPSDLQAFQQLALQSGYSPFSYSLISNYLNRAYSDWSNFTKATPWISFLNAVNPGGSGNMF